MWRLSGGVTFIGAHASNQFARLDLPPLTAEALRKSSWVDLKYPAENGEARVIADAFRLGLLERRIDVGNSPVFVQRWLGPGASVQPGAWGGGALRLDDMAYLRGGSEGTILASARHGGEVELVARKALEIVLSAITPSGAAIDGPEARLLADALADSGFLPLSGADVDDDTFTFHERLFHTRCREFRGLRQAGVTGWKDAVPRPDRQDFWTGTEAWRLPLPEPAPVPELVSDRESLLQDKDLTSARLEDISTLLDTGWRLRSRSGGTGFHRPFANAGAADELDIWLATTGTGALRAGVYRYFDADHSLVPMQAGANVAARLCRSAGHAWSGRKMPPVFLVISGRPSRLQWRYEGVGYGLMQIDAGAALQALTIGAVVAGLGVCPIGSIDGAAFVDLTGQPLHVQAPLVGLAVFGRLE